MKQDKLTNLFDFLPKSKVKAGDGLDEGKYPFYTSSENQSKYLDEFQHEPGCLVFGTGGKANVHFTTSRFATSTDCITIRPKPKARIDAGYVFQFFKGNMQVLESGFKGAGLKHISKAYLSDIQIPHPEELDDQERIAHLLGKVEGLIARRKQHLQQLDDLLKSVFLEMFGDPAFNPYNWGSGAFKDAIEYIGDIGSNGSNAVVAKNLQMSDEEDYALMVRTVNLNANDFTDNVKYVSKETYDFFKKSKVFGGELIMNKIGSAGLFWIMPNLNRPVSLGLNQLLIRIKKEVPIAFIYHFYSTQFGQTKIANSIRGAATKSITKTAVKELPLLFPPIDLQNQFAAIVEKVEVLKSRYQQSLTDLEILYGALSQKAFKGELDLSRVVLPAEGPEIAEEETTDVEEKQPMEPLFELPAPAELAVLQTAKGRKSLLGEWLNAWLEHLGGAPFAAQAFMDAARQRLWELAEDEAPDWGVAEYDELKSWVFEALEQGRLIQGYDDANNRVQITAVKG